MVLIPLMLEDFLVGFLTLLPFFIIFEFKKIKKRKLNKKKISYFLFFLGFILAIGQELQQISLIYTDVANTGVFTVFYVLVVPVISYFIFSKKNALVNLASCTSLFSWWTAFK